MWRYLNSTLLLLVLLAFWLFLLCDRARRLVELDYSFFTITCFCFLFIVLLLLLPLLGTF